MPTNFSVFSEFGLVGGAFIIMLGFLIYTVNKKLDRHGELIQKQDDKLDKIIVAIEKSQMAQEANSKLIEQQTQLVRTIDENIKIQTEVTKALTKENRRLRGGVYESDQYVSHTK